MGVVGIKRMLWAGLLVAWAMVVVVLVHGLIAGFRIASLLAPIVALVYSAQFLYLRDLATKGQRRSQ